MTRIRREAGTGVIEQRRKHPKTRLRIAAALRAEQVSETQQALGGDGGRGAVDYMIIPLMAAEMYGVAIMGRVMGLVLTADGVAEAVAPMIVASIRDRTGSYGGGFLVLVALAIVGAAAVACLPRQPRRTDSVVESTAAT